MGCGRDGERVGVGVVGGGVWGSSFSLGMLLGWLARTDGFSSERSALLPMLVIGWWYRRSANVSCRTPIYGVGVSVMRVLHLVGELLVMTIAYPLQQRPSVGLGR